MRSIIVRYPSFLCKSLVAGAPRRATVPGGDVPPYGTWVPVPFPLSYGDPSPSPAICPCGSLPPTLHHNPRSSGTHGAPCLRSRATFPPTGESPTYLLERAHVPTGESPRTYWREPTYLPERAHVPTGESPRTYWREPTYLLERAHVPTGESPRTYWREPTYLLERAHVPTGERQASNLLFWKGLETRRLYRRLEEDTDNRVCVV